MSPVVVTRTRKPETARQGLPFNRDMIPDINGADSFIHEYRARAWDAYERLPLPTTADEAWRGLIYTHCPVYP